VPVPILFGPGFAKAGYGPERIESSGRVIGPAGMEQVDKAMGRK